MNVEKKVPVITIDGPSGTGKGTLSQMLAVHLGWHFLDSGALYRVLAYAAIKEGVALDEALKLEALARVLPLKFSRNDAGRNVVFLEGIDISSDIRMEQCGQNASKIAALPGVRLALLARQRAFAEHPGLVTDGRDMGTVVFPDALLKVYLYASTEERANRRYLQLKESGNDASLAQVVDELVKRDARDSERVHSPLKPASDAVWIDTTGLTIDEVFKNVVQLIGERSLT